MMDSKSEAGFQIVSRKRKALSREKSVEVEVKRPRGGQRSRGFDLRWLSFPVGSQLVASSREPTKKRPLTIRSQPTVSSRSPLRSHGGTTLPQPPVPESLSQPIISGRSIFVFGRSPPDTSDRQIGTAIRGPVEVRNDRSFLEVASRSQSRPRGPNDEQRETNERARMTNPVLLEEEKRNGERGAEGEEPMETEQSAIRLKTEVEENTQTKQREEMKDDTSDQPRENAEAGKCGRSPTDPNEGEPLGTQHFTQKGKERVGTHEQEETTQLMEKEKGEVTESGEGPGAQHPSDNICRGEASTGRRVTEVSLEGRAHLGSLDVIEGQRTQPKEGGLEGQGVEEGAKVDGVGETDQESGGRSGGQGVEWTKVDGVGEIADQEKGGGCGGQGVSEGAKVDSAGETGQERCAGIIEGQGVERVEGEIDPQTAVGLTGGQGVEREGAKVDGVGEIIVEERCRDGGGQRFDRGGEGKEDSDGGEGEGGKRGVVGAQKGGGDVSRHPSLSRHTRARRLTCFGPLFKRFSTQAPLHGLSPARLETDPLWDFLPKDSGLSSQDLERAERRHSRSLSQGGGIRRKEVDREEEKSRKEGEELGGVGEGEGQGGQVVESCGGYGQEATEAYHFGIGGVRVAGGGVSRGEGPRGKGGGQAGQGGGGGGGEGEMEGVGGTQGEGEVGGEKGGGGAGGVGGGRGGEGVGGAQVGGAGGEGKTGEKPEGESGEEGGSRGRRGGDGGRLLSCGNNAMDLDSLFGDASSSSRCPSPPSDRAAIGPLPIESCLPIAPRPRGTHMDLGPSSSHDISLHSERIGTPPHAVEPHHPMLLLKQQRRRAEGTGGGRGGRGGRRRGRGGDVVTKEGDKDRFALVHECEDSAQSECATRVDSENEAMVGSEGENWGMGSDGGGGRHSALRRRFNTQRGRWRRKVQRDGSVSVSGSSSCSRTSPSEVELEAFPRGGKTPLAPPNRNRSTEKIQHETNREGEDAAYPPQILLTLEGSLQVQGRKKEGGSAKSPVCGFAGQLQQAPAQGCSGGSTRAGTEKALSLPAKDNCDREEEQQSAEIQGREEKVSSRGKGTGRGGRGRGGEKKPTASRRGGSKVQPLKRQRKDPMSSLTSSPEPSNAVEPSTESPSELKDMDIDEFAEDENDQKKSHEAHKQKARACRRSKKPESSEAVKGEEEEIDGLTWEWICTSSVPTLRHIPKGARQTWSEVLEGTLQKAVERGRIKDWKLLLALPKLCLRAPPRGGKKKKIQRIRTTEWTTGLLCRARQGKWADLLAEAKEVAKKMKQSTGSQGQQVSRERE